MTKEDFAQVGVKLAGIYCLISPVIFLPNLTMSIGLLSSLGNTERWEMILAAFVPILIPIALGTVLIIFSEQIAFRLVGNKTKIQSETKIDSSIFMAMATAFSGILLVGNSLPETCIWAVRLFSQAISPAHITLNEFMAQHWQKMSAVIFELILGLLFFFQSNGVSNLWHRFYGRAWIEKD